MKRGQFVSLFGSSLPVVRSAGMMQFDPVWASKRHLSGGMEIMHITRGQIALEMTGGPFEAGPGDTLLVPPSTRHRDYFDPEHPLEMFHCSVVWKAAVQYCRKVKNGLLLALQPEIKARVAIMFDQLRADFAGLSDVDQLVVRSRVLTILMLMLRETAGRMEADSDGGPVSRHQRLMQQAKIHVEQNYSRAVTLDDIAAALRVSPYHLCHVFRAESEFSLFAYLTQVRMDKARVLLREGKLSIKEIARSVGYDSQNYFARAFRKTVGWTPREYAARNP